MFLHETVKVWDDKAYTVLQYMLFGLAEVRTVRRLIGYSLFCIAIGMLITLFINSHVLIAIFVGALLLIGYQLFCC